MRINLSSCLPSIPARAGLLPLVNTATTRLAISERLAVMANHVAFPCGVVGLPQLTVR